MAVRRTNESAKLVIQVGMGTTEAGKASYKNRTVGNIDPKLSDADFYEVAAGLASLQAHPVNRYTRTESAVIERMG